MTQYKLQLVFLSLLTLAACGPVQKMKGASTSDSDDAPTEKATHYILKINRPALLMKANADVTSGEPSFYLVNANLVQKAQASQLLQANSTVCYAKIVGPSPAGGEEIEVNYKTSSETKGGRTLQYMNITQSNPTDSSSFGLVCMKLRATVREIDVKNAFRSIVTFTKW